MKTSSSTHNNITKREQQVLQLIAYERSSHEIAEELFVSYETAQSHRKNLLKKLQVKNTAGMVRVAFERGLLRLNYVACLLLFFCSSAQLDAQITNDNVNYQVRTKAFSWEGNEDTGNNEEPTFWVKVKDDDDLIATDLTNITTIDDLCYEWSADCEDRCFRNNAHTFSAIKDQVDGRYDITIHSWENDGPGDATCPPTNQNFEDKTDVGLLRNAKKGFDGTIRGPSQWIFRNFQLSNSSIMDWEHAWRYTNGDDLNTALDFGTLGTEILSHDNANRQKPPGASNDLGYTSKWTGSNGIDVFYKFTVPAGGKKVTIIKSATTASLRVRLLDSSTNGANTGIIISNNAAKSSTAMTRQLCAGTYYIVVEGSNSDNQSDFIIFVKPESIDINAGSIDENSISRCEGQDIGTISSVSSASSANLNVSYQWRWHIDGQPNEVDIVGATEANLTAAQAGEMPGAGFWLRRNAKVCDGSTSRGTIVKRVNLTPSNTIPGSISFNGDVPADDPTQFTIPRDRIDTNIGMFSGDVATGTPGGAIMEYQVQGPSDSEFSSVSSGQNWTPDGSIHFLEAGDHQVRRMATNGCGKKRYTNVITIKVRSNNDLGSIKGSVTAFGSSAGVPGVTVEAVRTNLVEGGTYTQISYSAITDSKGDYTIDNIYYGDDDDIATYTITPSLANPDVHEFSPPGEQEDIDLDSKDKTAVDFTDNTSLSISGKIYQEYDDDGNGLTECGMDTVAILVDGIPTDSTVIDANGEGTYSLSVSVPGNYAITVAYKGQAFTREYTGEVTPEDKIKVFASVQNLDFKSTTTKTISGKLTDGCGAAILDGQEEATITFIDDLGCWMKVVPTMNNGEFTATLPARAYSINVDHPSSLVNAFFSVKPYVDLSERDTSGYLLKYKAQPVVTITDLAPALGCPGYEDIPQLEQVGIYPYEIQVFEKSLFSQVVNTCPVDTGTIEIIDNIGEDRTVELAFTNGAALDTIIAGGPNLIAPHTKKLSVFAIDALGHQSEVECQYALVTGARATASNFDLVTPELPMMILRDPPGDQSYAFFEETETHEISTKYYTLKGGSNNKWGNVRVGSQFEAGIIGFDVETKIWNDQQLNVTHGSKNISTTESIETTQVSSRYQTSDNELIIGEDGDIIIGASMVMNYSTADIVSVDGCEVILSKELIVAPKAVRTQYALRTGFIKDVTIPSLEEKVQNPPNPDSLLFYKDQVRIWKHILMYNDSLKNEAIDFTSITRSDGISVPPVITFSDNVQIDYSVTSKTSEVLTTEFMTEIDKDIANEVGIEVAGAGASGGYIVNFKTEKGEASTATSTSEFTSGFRFLDGDTGDGFSVKIMADPVFKTPVFELQSGQTSCPWEPGTQKRDDPQLTAINPIQTNIPDGATRTFDFELANLSETTETRAYHIRFINESNSGAKIEFQNTANQNYIVAPGGDGVIPVEVNISQFSNPRDEFSFEGIVFEAVPLCEQERFPAQISDQALISAYFQSPCTDIDLEIAGDSWIINSMMTTIPITIKGYTKAGLSEVQLEYLEVGTYNWAPAMPAIPAADLLNNDPLGQNLGTTIQYNASNLPDGEYYLRLKAVCSGQPQINNYSARIIGIKDTKAPAILGLPMPVDDIYDSVEDLITAQFDELVKSVNASNAYAELIRLDDNMNNQTILFTLSSTTASVVPSEFITGINTTPGAYRVILYNIEDINGNVADPISWVFITPGYEVDGACSVLDIANNNNDQDAISVSNYRGTSISSDGTVPGFGETSYLATESISLESNFEVMPGGEFLADIYPCDEDICENVTSASSKANVAGDIVWWRIEEEGDCVSGIYQTNGNAGDIFVQAQNFADANEETVNVNLVYNTINKQIVLTSAGATVSFGKYLSAGGTLYTIEVILSIEEGRNDSTIVVATVKMTVLPPDTTPPVISIDPITGDDVLDAIEVFSPLAITGTTDAEDLQEVTVSIGANTYMTAVDQGAWSVSVPAIVIQSIPQGASQTVTADVSDFVGNAATQASRTFTKDDSTPAQIPISGIDYYDELMDGSYPGPSSPQGEGMDKLIDGDILTKFLSFDQTYEDPFTGEDVYVEGTIEVILDLTTQETPSRLSVTTANDEPDRDPQVLYILGSNDGLTFDNLGAAIPIACGTDRFTTRVYDINNTTPYQYYVVRFLDQCNASANSMQLAEVALWGN